MSRIEAAVAAASAACPKCHAISGAGCIDPECGFVVPAAGKSANTMEFRIAKLDLKPGDILAIRPSEPRAPEELFQAARSLRTLVPPGVRVIAVDADVALTVIRPADPEYAAAAALAAQSADAGHRAHRPVTPPGGHRHTEESER